MNDLSLNYYFPASLQDAEQFPEGSIYDLSRNGLFRSIDAALSAITEHKTEKTHPLIVELSVPDYAVIDHSDLLKISLRKGSHSRVSRHLPVKELLGKSVSAREMTEAEQ